MKAELSLCRILVSYLLYCQRLSMEAAIYHESDSGNRRCPWNGEACPFLIIINDWQKRYGILKQWGKQDGELVCSTGQDRQGEVSLTSK